MGGNNSLNFKISRLDNNKFLANILPWEKIFLYFSEIPLETTKTTLYNWVLEDKALSDFAIEIIAEMDLVDYKRIHELLRMGDNEVDKKAVRLLSYEKKIYEGPDIIIIKHITDMLEQKYPKVKKITEGSDWITGEQKRVWVCQCGHENDEGTEYCFKCKKDYYGFTSSEKSPPQVVEMLLKKAKILEENISTI